MNRGQVSTLVILGGNPVYTAPADLQFGAALAKVANSIHLGLDEDETAAAAKWHLPEAHISKPGAMRDAIDGTVAIQQPMIDAMYGGKTSAEMVALVIDSKDTKAYDIVKNFWTAQWPGRTDSRQRVDLAEGAERRHHRRRPSRPKPSKPIRRREENRGGDRRRAESRRGRHRSRLRPQRSDVGRPIRQQRLDAGSARPDDQADLGQRGADQSGDRARAESQGRRHGHAVSAAG